METRRQQEIKSRKSRNVLARSFISFGRALIILTISAVVTLWLFNSETITSALFYNAGVPRNYPEWSFMVAVGLLLAVLLNILSFLLIAWISPRSRRRTGEASLD